MVIHKYSHFWTEYLFEAKEISKFFDTAGSKQDSANAASPFTGKKEGGIKIILYLIFSDEKSINYLKNNVNF